MQVAIVCSVYLHVESSLKYIISTAHLLLMCMASYVASLVTCTRYYHITQSQTLYSHSNVDTYMY